MTEQQARQEAAQLTQLLGTRQIAVPATVLTALPADRKRWNCDVWVVVDLHEFLVPVNWDVTR